MNRTGPAPDTPESDDGEVGLPGHDPGVPETRDDESPAAAHYLQSFTTSDDRSQERATVYWILVAVLFMGASLFRRFPFPDNEQRHVIWEFVSTTLAFMVGSLSLVRYYSKKQDTFLFIGTGFLGAGVLNMYHAVMTSALVGGGGRTLLQTADADAWSWTASRLFLSLFLFATVFLWSKEEGFQEDRLSEKWVYGTAAALTVVVFIFFSALGLPEELGGVLFIPATRAYYPDFWVVRPAEFIPAIFFFAAWVGYLRRGQWRTEPFEHWLLISLMISVFVHAMYMSQATSEFDGMADAAHLLKISANVCVLVGLMVSVFVTFRSEADALRAVRDTNLAMAREVRDRRAKSQFLANMSHELRTPLNSVIGFANILLKNKKGNLGGSDLGFLERIQVNGKHLLVLINEILDLAKIESGRMELELRTVSLPTLVQEAVALVDGQIRQKRGAVGVRIDAPEVIDDFDTDSGKLKQVIVNLMGNALKFTESGEIVIRATLQDGTNKPGSVQVQDSGIGIPRARLGAIFEAFQQAEGSTARKFGGTGLGLTISRSMCLLMGYDLTVESEVGKGTTFTIDLTGLPEGTERPTVEAAEEPGTEESDVAAPATRRDVQVAGAAPIAKEEVHEQPQPEIRHFKVLVIDDEADSRVLMQHYLGEFGCEVLEAESGSEGLEMAKEHQPDLITLDLQMPEMDGWEVLRRLKDDPEVKDIPVVVASIIANEGRGRLLGAVDLLNKPIDRTHLLRVLWRNLVNRAEHRVLVVDDDPEVHEFVTAQLKPEGLDVVCVSSGQEALEEVASETPGAILLDLAMPGMHGLTFLDRLRENPYHVGLPVIVITGKNLSDAEKTLLSDKVSGVVLKGEGFNERLLGFLNTLFPMASADVDRESTEG